MAEKYLCRRCENNHNGWCVKYKKQGLKQIFECEAYKGDAVEVKPKVSKTINSLSKEATIHRIIGKSEMLLFMYNQLIKAKNEQQIEAVIKAFTNTLVFQYDLHNIEQYLDSSLDATLIKSIRELNEMEEK